MAKKQLTINISEELLEKLEAKAGVCGVAVQDYVLLALAEYADRPASLEQALVNLEGLILQNLYWAALPYQEGLPKARLNDKGLEVYWDKSAAFARQHCSVKDEETSDDD